MNNDDFDSHNEEKKIEDSIKFQQFGPGPVIPLPPNNMNRPPAGQQPSQRPPMGQQPTPRLSWKAKNKESI